MADWAHTPMNGYRIRRVPKPTLISMFEDGGEIRRQKHANSPRIFSGRFRTAEAVAESMMDQYDTSGTLDTLTIISWDPQDATTGTTEATVRFTRPPDLRVVAFGQYEVRVEFREVL